MSNKWKYNKLSSLCTKIGDGLHGTPEYYSGTGYFFINGNNLERGKIEITKNTKTISETEYKKNYIALSDKSLLLGINGSIGNMAFYNNEKVILGKSAAYLNFKTNINIFYYYYFQLKNIQKYFYDVATGSIIKNLSLQSIQDFSVPVPEETEWKNIISALSSLDSKIELNNRINTELEQMAKTLYDYWFVQFDFPNNEGKPYKTSGGKMVWVEELKRDIPEGWKVKEMNKILTKNTAKFDFVDDKHDIDTLDLSVMPSATMCLNEKNSSSAFGTNLFKLNKFDILFGGIRPYLLKAGFSPFDGLVTGTVHSFNVKNNDEYNFAILTMTHKSMFHFAVANSKGTKMPVIGADDLLTYKIAYNENIIRKFNNHLQFKDIIAHNIIENQKLANLRDWLLPMLMNGQVKIK